MSAFDRNERCAQMLKFTFKTSMTGICKDINKWADAQAKEMRKALSIAITKVIGDKKTGLRRRISDDLKHGRLGLKPKSKYRNMGTRIRKGQQVYMKLDKRYRAPRGRSAFIPLAQLFRGVEYESNWRRFVSGADKEARWAVGFLGRNPGTSWQVPIARKSIAGYRWFYPRHAREYLHEMGIHLRATTKSGKVPPRNIIGAARKKYPDRMLLYDIKRLFDRKMSGERI